VYCKYIVGLYRLMSTECIETLHTNELLNIITIKNIKNCKQIYTLQQKQINARQKAKLYMIVCINELMA